MSYSNAINFKNPPRIYGLFDPYALKFFYVGMARDVDSRFQQHINETRLNAAHGSKLLGVQEYILQMSQRKQEPIVIVLDELRTDNNLVAFRFLHYAERFWMYHLKQMGHPITNVHGIKYAALTPDVYQREFEYRLHGFYADVDMPHESKPQPVPTPVTDMQLKRLAVLRADTVKAKIKNRNTELLRKIAEFRELASHRNPAVAQAAKSQLKRMVIEARRCGLNTGQEAA